MLLSNRRETDGVTSLEWLWKKLSDLKWEDVNRWLEQYESLGPLPGIFATMIESFLPFLPLVAIVVANAEAYGLWLGFLYSWIGVVTGSTLVFLIFRQFGGLLRVYVERKYPKTLNITAWIERKGFTLIFLLACFPFTPSSLVNVVSGLSRLPIHTFVTATLLGKGVMIFLISYAGYDLTALVRNPWKLVFVIVLFAILWWAGRKMEARYMR